MKNKNIIASYPLQVGICVLIHDIIYDINDSVVYSVNNYEEKQTNIEYTPQGEAFFYVEDLNVEVYLNECLKINI